MGEVPSITTVVNTGSRLITAVKQHWAWLVLGWVTAWEHHVLLVFLFLRSKYFSYTRKLCIGLYNIYLLDHIWKFYESKMNASWNYILNISKFSALAFTWGKSWHKLFLKPFFAQGLFIQVLQTSLDGVQLNIITASVRHSVSTVCSNKQAVR